MPNVYRPFRMVLMSVPVCISLINGGCGDGGVISSGTGSSDNSSSGKNPSGTGSAGGSGGGFRLDLPDGGGVAGTKGPLGAANACGVQKYDLKKQPAELLLVLDRSGSMKDPFVTGTTPGVRPMPGAMQTDKWAAAVNALNTVISKTQASVLWGLKLFPLGGICGVPNGVNVPVAINNHTMVMAAINGSPAVLEGTGTPTQAAVRNATAFMKTLTSPNPKYLVLATDGLPNCAGGTLRGGGDDSGAVQSVAEAAAAGFPTFVVGIGIDRMGVATLNAMADKGGRPRSDPNTRYYPVTSQDEFTASLEQITGQVASCSFPLNPPPPDASNVAVDIDGVRLQRDTTGANGWNYVGAGNSSLLIQGPVCDKLKSGVAKNVQILFGCPGMKIP